MSTEAIATPQKAEKGKKRKKGHDGTEESYKKRKTSEHREPAADDAPEARTKKRKSEKTRHSEAIAELSETKKKKKKDTHKHKHKKRSDEDPESQQQNTTQSTSTSPQDEFLQSHSPFSRKTASFYLALSPCANDFPLEGLCAEHISPLLLTYYAPLQGVILAFEKPRLSERPEGAVQARSDSHAREVLSRSINEYAVTFVWLTVDFVLFQPMRGRWLEGHVGLQNEGLLGLICYNYFNAAVAREKLPEGWGWVSEDDGGGDGSRAKKKSKGLIDDSGYFVDGEGKQIEGKIIFQVEDFEATPGADGGGGTVSIIGTLRPEP